MRRLSGALASLALLLAPSAARAEDQGLSNILLSFFTPARPFTLAFTGHEAHFSSATEARSTLNLLNRNIAYQLASFPLGSSSGGFTFTLDPTLGVLNRSAESFGPLFAERALTAGKGKLTMGANYQRSTWDRFEGQSLEGGDVALTLTHEDIDGSGDHLSPFFEGDLIDARLRMKLTTDTTVVFANYGVSDRFDVGVAVPFVRVKMDATIHTTIVPLSTGTNVRTFHIFDPNQDTGCGGNRVSGDGLQNDFCANGDASGIGDIVVRGKLGLSQGDSLSLAAGVDVRLPTGKEEDLLGTGAAQVKPYLVAGFLPRQKFSPHVNLGYTFTGESDLLGTLPDEVDWTVGFDAAPSSRLTITADVIGRALIDAQRLRTRDRVFPYRLVTDPPRPFQREEVRPEYFAQDDTLSMILGSAGFKLNPFGRLLVSFNALFPLTKNNGLQDDFTPVFAIDYNF